VAAEGEFQAAVKLGEAADIISQHPVALQCGPCRRWRRSASRRIPPSSSRLSS
jgi:bacterioferritin-associated ferredoxin